MLKQTLLDLINEFEKETWKYECNQEKLDQAMEYVYSIEKEIKKCDETNLQILYDKLTALIGIIRFKYGYESILINSLPKLESLKNLIQELSLDNEYIIEHYNYILESYNNYLRQVDKADFIENKYTNVTGKEGLFLAVESLKSLINNSEYRHLLKSEQIAEVFIDCIKLNNGITDIKKMELKYKEIISKIWEQSLQNTIDESGKFRVLFSNISGGNLIDQANLLRNRVNQSSCSLISSNFIATYGSLTRRIGFIYPNNSKIIMASAYDLASNVFGNGVTNKEKGTMLATPYALEKIGINRTKEKGESLYTSSCYSEILVESNPCGILVLGLGENDLNIDYNEALKLSEEMKLPIHFVDLMQYVDDLSDLDKYYIAFHSIMSFLGISTEDLLQHDYSEIYEIINDNKEKVAEIFLELKKNNNLNKESMYLAISNKLDIDMIGKLKK